MKRAGWNPPFQIFVKRDPDPSSSSGAGCADSPAIEALSRPGFEAAESCGPERICAAVFGLEPGRWLRRLPRRETFFWGATGSRLVVKRMLGGLDREALRELTQPSGPLSPGRREFENLLALAREGLPVPTACAWCEERGVLGRPLRSAVVMRVVPHAETLLERLQVAPEEERRRWSEELAGLVARLHGLGWYHRDLYLEHFVVVEREGERELCLLDVGRARRESHPRRRWFVKDLAALSFSAPPSVSRATRARFLASWCERSGRADGASRREWARAVLAKVRRMAAHVPRHDPPRAAAQGATNR